MSLTVETLSDVFSLADFLSTVLGNHSEIVIHDTSTLDQSIVYIHNGHLSGRKVGDAMTDYALKLIKNSHFKETDYITNYYSKNINSHKFRSSTYFIKNKRGLLIGLLCINVDITHIEEARSVLDSFLCLPSVQENEKENTSTLSTMELLSGNPADTVKEMTQSILSTYNVEVERLTKEEKIEIISTLHDSGVFLMKGSVSIVASELKLSDPTVYRYLQKLN